MNHPMKMKKTITILILVLAVWACHHKIIPADNTIIISNKTTKTKTETTINAISDVDLTTAGKTVYITRCNRCNALKKTGKFSQQQWNNILKSMIPKARLNDAEAKQLTGYVMANAKK